jgi:fibronectin-binding autotransporter adhesin
MTILSPGRKFGLKITLNCAKDRFMRVSASLAKVQSVALTRTRGQLSDTDFTYGGFVMNFQRSRQHSELIGFSLWRTSLARATASLAVLSGLGLVAGSSTSSAAQVSPATARVQALVATHSLRPVTHWLSRRTNQISPKAVHRTYVIDNSFDGGLNTVGCNTGHSVGSCTLRNAIYAASNDSGHFDAITIPSGRHLNLSGSLTISSSMMINGAGAFLDGNGNQALVMTSNAALTIYGLTVTNGFGTDGGGLQCISGSLVLNAVNFNHNTATNGGALQSSVNCNVWIDNSTFASNNASTQGGAFETDGSAYITRSTFGGSSDAAGNRSESGGAIYNSDGHVILDHVTVKHNYSTLFVYGAGIYNDESMDISNSAISYNHSIYGGDGGGIYNRYNLQVTNTFINYNNFTGSATSAGAGVYADGYVTTLINDTLTGNSNKTTGTLAQGAAIYSSRGQLRWSGGSVSGTSSGINGMNTEVDGGVLYVSSITEVAYVTGVSISTTTNVALPTVDVFGGDFYLDGPTHISSVHISKTSNHAQNIEGGAIYNNSVSSFDGTTIAGTNNHASFYKGGFIEGGVLYSDDYASISSMSITSTTSLSDVISTPLPTTYSASVSGGVLYNLSHLTVNGLSISGGSVNATGGSGYVEGGVIYNNNLLEADNTQVLGFTIHADYYTSGGLVYNTDHLGSTNFTVGNSTVNVTGSSIRTAFADGAIWNNNQSSTISNLVNATFSNITMQMPTSGVYNWGFEVSGQMQFSNSTLANIKMTGPSGPTNLTLFAGEPSSLISFHNSIVASSVPWKNCYSYNVIQSAGYNIDNGNSCGFKGLGDMSNTSPKVQNLANNGGSVLTAALTSPGSLAINHGTNVACPATDARGVARPQGGTCDIGAYEYVRPLK